MTKLIELQYGKTMVPGHTIVPNLNNESIILDCGGCVGHFVIAVLEKWNPYIYVFEPDPELVAIMKDKFKDNSKISIYNKGVSHKKSKEYFYKCKSNYKWERYASGSFQETKHNVSDDGKVMVETTTVEEIMKNNNIDLIDLLKLDIEGNELDVIENIPESTLKKIKQITIEWHVREGIKNYTRARLRYCREKLIDSGFTEMKFNLMDSCYYREII